MAKEETITPEKAKEVLLKEQQEAIKKCTQEVQVVLDKYNMQLNAFATIPAEIVQIGPKVNGRQNPS